MSEQPLHWFYRVQMMIGGALLGSIVGHLIGGDEGSSWIGAGIGIFLIVYLQRKRV